MFKLWPGNKMGQTQVPTGVILSLPLHFTVGKATMCFDVHFQGCQISSISSSATRASLVNLPGKRNGILNTTYVFIVSLVSTIIFRNNYWVISNKESLNN